MEKKRIAILGAGISGLSLARSLSEKSPAYEISLFEKSARPGGWIESESESGFLFEGGPRIFKVSRCKELLELVEALELKDKLIFSADNANVRYLFENQRLQRFPTGLWSFLTSPLTRPLLFALTKEWRIPAREGVDESIFDFAARRFGTRVAELLFDPLTLGIYAGDIRRLSLRSCFAPLKKWEEEWGSVTKGALKQRRKRGSSSALFSFKGGMSTLIDALVDRCGATLHLNQEVKSLKFEKGEVELLGQRFDHLFIALPAHATAELIPDAEIASLLRAIVFQSVTVVNLGYTQKLDYPQGFGYLIPSKEGEKILGAIFNSAIFPQQSCHPEESRFTFMLREGGESKEEALEIALEGMRRHLKIFTAPTATSVKKISHALPQYEVGHGEKIARLEAAMAERFPTCSLLGNYLHGPSVNDCVTLAKKRAHLQR
jgi:protoporphyrinogen/coproporphyrinogen III oxidase